MTIAATLLTADVDTTGTADDYTTASIAPTGNELVLAMIVNTRFTATPAVPTLSGNGLTWVQVATVTINPSTDHDMRLTLFRAMGASPSSGVVTINVGGVDTHSGCAWVITEFSGVDTTGSDGANAIVQAVTNSDIATPTSLTVTLASFASATNAAYGGINVNSNPGITQGTGFTEIADIALTAPNNKLETEFLASEDTSVDWSWTGGQDCQGIAVEIAEPSTANPDRRRRSASATY